MQLDLFGATREEATQETAPPIITNAGAWRHPETEAFDAALRTGSLINVVAILNKLKTEAAAKVLLASGFAITTMKDRAQLMKDVQAQLVAAVRLKMTGHELRDHREKQQAEQATAREALESGTLINNSQGPQEATENHDHGSTLQTRAVRGDDGPQNRVDGIDGGLHREPVGAGVAGSSDRPVGRQPVPEQADRADRAGEGRSGERDGNDPSVAPRDPGDARGAAGTAGSDTPGGLTTPPTAGSGSQPSDTTPATPPASTPPASSGIALLQQIEAAWRQAIPEDGRFIINRLYPATATLNGVTRRFGVSKASSAGPFRLTALVQNQLGPQFNYYKLTPDGEVIREGQKNLWALAPEAREIQINEFKAVFLPVELANGVATVQKNDTKAAPRVGAEDLVQGESREQLKGPDAQPPQVTTDSQDASSASADTAQEAAKTVSREAPGTRHRLPSDAPHLERLKQVIDTFHPGRNTLEGNARAVITHVIQELERPRTVASVTAMLEKASSDLMKQWPAQAQVVEEVAEALKDTREMAQGQEKPSNEGHTIVGRRADGVMIRQDNNGVRFYAEAGVRISESVSMRPTPEGMRLTRGELKPDFMTAEESAAQRAQKAPARDPGVPDVEDLGAFIRVAADSVEELRRVDVMRVLESNSLRKFSLARYIAEKRPDLEQEVSEVMADEFGLPDWRARQDEVGEKGEIQSNESKAVVQPQANAQPAPAAGVQIATVGTAAHVESRAAAELRPASAQPSETVPPSRQKPSAPIPLGPRPPMVGPIKYTREQLESMYVTQMTDQQLHQALEFFTEGSRAQAIRLQIEKRAQEAQASLAAKAEAEQAEALASVRAVKPAGQERYGERLDHVITDADQIGQGGLMEKYRDNVRAIQLVRTLDAENRNATADELRVLARYVGWGGLKGVFDPQNKNWAQQHVELKSLLTDAEWAAASRSQLDAFYTAPVVVDAMYAGLSRMGYNGGRMIDPAMGSGNFVGMMPAEMRRESSIHGVELDILTSRIAAALYPTAKIAKATGFQAYNAPAGYFDLVVGNPPFGSQPIVDERGSAYSGWSIHNYFFAKSIELLRPGALMSLVVSHYFLDRLDPQVRQWISRRAELVSGVRLPNNAFKGNANTEVVTDVLIFRRVDHENSLGRDERPDWLETTDVEIENPKTRDIASLAVNNYFLKNPQNVLGKHSAEGTMYRANEYTVVPDESKGTLQEQLARWVETLPVGIYSRIERTDDVEVTATANDIPEHIKEGSFFLKEPKDGPAVWQRLPDQRGEQRAVPWEAPNERAGERMVGMIRIREALRAQMRLERSSEATDPQIEFHRRELNRVYDGFNSKFGFLNDPVNRRIFLDDTESPLVQALEFDYEKAITPAYAQEHGVDPRPARAVKADIFSRRVLFPPGELEVVETAKDALLHSLNQRGRVDLEYMQRAYGREEKEIVAELGDLIYVDPKSGTVVTADEYLSGDVKTKLAHALEAAKEKPELQRNVQALQSIIPADKMPSEIHAAIGASWIPTKHYQAFAREISGGEAAFTYVRSTGQWLTGEKRGINFAKNNNEFGTPKMGAIDILGLAMNSRAPEVKKPVEVEGQTRYVTDEEQTEAARQAADKIKSHWESWLWAILSGRRSWPASTTNASTARLSGSSTVRT
ncbi:TPA: Eco57I restriction-modification methylase domain-containing protein [Burkholderia lata]